MTAVLPFNWEKDKIYQPLGPVKDARLILENRFGVNKSNILEKLKKHLAQLENVTVMDPEIFRCFFFAGNTDVVMLLSQKCIGLYETPAQADYSNTNVLTPRLGTKKILKI